MRVPHLLRLLPAVLTLGLVCDDASAAPSSLRQDPPADATEQERDGPGVLSAVAWTPIAPDGTVTGWPPAASYRV
jgi:hypothetical protein